MFIRNTLMCMAIALGTVAIPTEAGAGAITSNPDAGSETMITGIHSMTAGNGIMIATSTAEEVSLDLSECCHCAAVHSILLFDDFEQFDLEDQRRAGLDGGR